MSVHIWYVLLSLAVQIFRTSVYAKNKKAQSLGMGLTTITYGINELFLRRNETWLRGGATYGRDS